MQMRIASMDNKNDNKNKFSFLIALTGDEI